MAEMIRGASTKTTHGVDNSKKAGVYMPKKQPEPIITHVEIYSRAIRNILDEIKVWEDRCKDLPQEQRDSMVSRSTAHLLPKLNALKEMYRMESGSEYN